VINSQVLNFVSLKILWAAIALSVYRIAKNGRFGDRISVRAIFSAPVHTGPGAHPAFCTKGTGPFHGVKRPEHGVDHPSIISAEAKESVELHLYSLSVPYALIYGKYLPLFFTFTLPEYFSMTKGSMLDILCILTVDLQNI